MNKKLPIIRKRTINTLNSNYKKIKFVATSGLTITSSI